MNRFGLQSILRTVANSTGTDGDLLGRYLRERDEESFRSLVERHGRLVWSICRHLTRSDADAEDAFQATFLVLSQKANAIQKSESLGPWLHGVAYRICAKSRKAAERRTRRERAIGVGEASNAVPDSTWDRALAAVHEELAKLPETLRVPFVMCCLEGKGTSESAATLGWKLGTFSGRLTRAKDLLIAKLDARGLTAGAVASATIGIGAANAPATVITKTAAFAAIGSTIPSSIFYLSQGVLDMNIYRVKLLAAAVVLACGLGTGVGTVMVANAQQPPAQTVRLPDETVHNADLQFIDVSKWEYRFERNPVGYAPTIERFKQTLLSAEKDGWEFVGQVNTAGETPDQPVLPTLVFRKKAKYDTTYDHAISAHRMPFDKTTCASCHSVLPNVKNAKIADFEAQIAALRAKANSATAARFEQVDLPIGVNELKDIISRVAPKVGFQSLKVVVEEKTQSLLIRGDTNSVEWAMRLIRTLSGKSETPKPSSPVKP